MACACMSISPTLGIFKAFVSKVAPSEGGQNRGLHSALYNIHKFIREDGQYIC